MLPKDASVVNPYIWIIACLPFLPGVLMLTWHLEVRTYTRNGTLTLDPATIFSTGYFLIWGGLVFTYCSTVVLARLIPDGWCNRASSGHSIGLGPSWEAFPTSLGG